MRIERITIKNYRGIDNLTIDFKSNFNVLFGFNGSGKSTIIYAINDLLLLTRFFLEKKNPDVIVFSQYRIKDPGKDCLIIIDFDNNGKILLEKKVNHTQIQDENSLRLRDGSIAIFKNIDKEINFYSLIPGLANPMIQDIETSSERIMVNLENLPFFVKSRGIVNYRHINDEIIRLIHIENRDRIQSLDNGEDKEKSRNKKLELIRKSLKMIFEDFEEITFTYDNLSNREFISIKKSGQEFVLDEQLSSGEACVVIIVCILCINLYGKQNSKTDIVCIDEIDASLHPKWQIKICKILQEVFPETQFIITSHSPFIWFSTYKENIYLMRNNHNTITCDTDISTAKGEYIENLIAKYFDISEYDDGISQQVHEIENLFRKHDFAKAKESISSIRNEYGNIQVLDNLETEMEILYHDHD